MKDFNWSEFTKIIAIKTELITIYDAWTKPNELESWFLRNANFYRLNSAIESNEAVIKDDSYKWSWYLYDIIENGKITEANGIDFIQFTFAGVCLVDIKLVQENEYVILTLTQKNIPLDDDSKNRIRLGCDFGWSFFLLNLKSVYEGGLDLRNKDIRLKGMINN